MLDVVGYNYQERAIGDDHARTRSGCIFGSENGHQLANWTVVRDNDYVGGQFLWTGIDYLGEARRLAQPRQRRRTAGCVRVQEAQAWFRQSLWSGAPMVYLTASSSPAPAAAGAPPRRGVRVEEHWNWKADSTLTVSCYTNCQEVRLTLNDHVVGSKAASDAVDGVHTWEVPYEPGILKAVGRREGGAAAEFTLKTAGPAARIELWPDEESRSKEGVRQIEFRIVDQHGTRVPDADPLVTFTIEGAARVLGIGNANLASVEDEKDLRHRAYQGRGLMILQVTAEHVVVRAMSPGLAAARVELASNLLSAWHLEVRVAHCRGSSGIFPLRDTPSPPPVAHVSRIALDHWGLRNARTSSGFLVRARQT